MKLTRVPTETVRCLVNWILSSTYDETDIAWIYGRTVVLICVNVAALPNRKSAIALPVNVPVNVHCPFDAVVGIWRFVLNTMLMPACKKCLPRSQLQSSVAVSSRSLALRGRFAGIPSGAQPCDSVTSGIR